MLAWLSFCSELQTCIWPSWYHWHSLFLASVKSRLVLPFWYQCIWVVPEKRAVKRVWLHGSISTLKFAFALDYIQMLIILSIVKIHLMQLFDKRKYGQNILVLLEISRVHSKRLRLPLGKVTGKISACNSTTFLAHFLHHKCTFQFVRKATTCRECELCSGQTKSPTSQKLSLHWRLPGQHQSALPALLMLRVDLQNA